MLGDPADVLFSRGSLRLAFIAAMQHLPARQRAVLILREVLDWPAADAASATPTPSSALPHHASYAGPDLTAREASD
jgi:RNA polymerase sigma-70 factor, ECF subfamily